MSSISPPAARPDDAPLADVAPRPGAGSRPSTRRHRVDRTPNELPIAYWHRMLVGRWITSVLLFAIIAVTPMFGPHRWWLATAFAVVSAVQNLFLGRALARRGRFPWTMPAFDHLLACIAGFLIPPVLVWAIMVNVIGLPVTVISHGRRFATRLWAASIPAYVAIGLITKPDSWAIAVGVFVVAGLGNVNLVGDAADEERRVRDRYGDILDQLGVVVFESPGIGQRMTYVNDHVGKMLGCLDDDWLEPSWWESRVHPADHERWTDSNRQSIAGQSHQSTYRLIAEDGRVLHILEITRVMASAQGNTAIRGVLVDVTRQAEAEAQASQLELFVDQIPLALQIFEIPDPDDTTSIRMVAANRVACENVGATLSELLGEWPSRFAVIDTQPGNLEAFAEVRRSGRPLTDHERDWVDAEGRHRRVNIEAFALGGDLVGVSYEDITDRAEAEQRLRHQANHDTLTGLPSRSLLAERLDAALGRSEGHGERGALLVMDLDQFKEVNDALGHHHGDRLLIELAGRLADIAGDRLIARLGGDEFALAIEDGTARDAFEVAALIGRAFAEPIVIDGVTLQTNVSVGIALYPEHATDRDGLLQKADAAMYRAKTGGTGVALFTPEQTTASVRRLQLLGDLRTAIDQGQLTLHYQPRVAMGTGHIEGMEALVRWVHPSFGMLPPDEFIGLAEVSGLIQPLTRFVIRSAVADAARLAAAGHRLPVAVNLSVRNLYSPDLVDGILGSLAAEDLAPDFLRVELTESEIMDDPSVAMQMLQRLRSEGIEVSIDDFGTGYSSLSYLRDLPIDEIKIDRSFVADISGGDDVVVRSIIDLGHALGVSVVGEGVETAEQWEHLRRLGCDVAQGYLISRPLPFDALHRFLDDRRDFGYEGTVPGVGRHWEPPVTRG